MGHEYNAHVRHEKQEHDNRVSVALGQSQVLGHARNHCQAQVAPVDERDAVHEAEDGQEAEVDAAPSFFSF